MQRRARRTQSTETDATVVQAREKPGWLRRVRNSNRVLAGKVMFQCESGSVKVLGQQMVAGHGIRTRTSLFFLSDTAGWSQYPKQTHKVTSSERKKPLLADHQEVRASQT